ncbi:unnamed protein product [Blepharisma stoltei]|uniref:Uncharacterized protein n=1 Tax=Blepharisma stoltei TaxID=1481888 RepID=A0AAU9IMS4_9CILI|nr:unnamed protein product [Blepharisma stoltei]
MSNVLEFQLLKAEGPWNTETLGCYISVENRLLDVITPINLGNENIVDLPVTGTVRLSIKEMSNDDSCYGSVSFSVEKVPYNTTIWLPIFTNKSEDFLSEVPESTKSPRLLISVDSVIKENLESTMPRISLCDKNASYDEYNEDLDASITSSSKSPESPIHDTFSIDPDTSVTENSDKLRVLYKKQIALTQELTHQLNLCQTQLKFEQDRRESQDSRIIKISQEFEEAMETSQTRENSLLKLLEQKDIEITEAMNEITRLQGATRSLEGEKKQLSDFSTRIQAEITTAKLSELKKELLMTKENLVESERRRKELQNMLESIGNEWNKNCDKENESYKELQGKNKELEAKIENLEKISKEKDEKMRSFEKNGEEKEKEIEELKVGKEKLEEHVKYLTMKLVAADGEKQALASGLLESQNELQKLQSSFLHSLVQDTLRRHKFRGTLTKIQNNLYSINGKDFYLQAHNNQVVVKIGVNLIALEDFLQLSNPVDYPISLDNEDSFNSHHLMTFFSPPSSDVNTPRAVYDRKTSISTSDSIKQNKENDQKSHVKISPLSRFFKPTISSQSKIRTSLEKSPLAQRNSKSAERKRPFK